MFSFLGCISILISLIWFSRAISFVKYVTENGIAIEQFFALFLLILPWLLLFIIPISLLAAIIIVYNKLISTNELAILKNAGINKFSLAKPALFVALICSLICFAISMYFMPYANKKLRLSRNELSTNYTNLSINPKTFESLKSITIYVKNRNEENILYGILLHDKSSDQYSLTITAEKGHIVAQDSAALLYMENGTVQKFNYSTSKSEILNFDNYVFNLLSKDDEKVRFKWKQKERYLNELINYEDDLSEVEAARFKSEFHQRFVYPVLPIIFSLIALSSMMHGAFSRRGNSRNVVLASVASTILLATTIALFQAIEKNAQFVYLLYLNLAAFSSVSLYFIHEQYQKIKPTKN